MAISEKDLPANWGVKGGPYDEVDEKINWFKSTSVTIQELLDAGWITSDEVPWFESKGLKRSSAPVAPVNTVSAEDTAFLNRVSALASELKQPEFVIHDQFNRGLSENEIRAKYTPTANIAEQLIEASMATGVSDTAPVNFQQYGGYDKVLDKYLESGQNLSLASLTPEQLQSAATKVNETGVGNLNTLAITGTPISQTALNAMTKSGVDPATVAQIAKDYSAANIKTTQTKAVQDLISSTPNVNTTDLFSKYVDQAKGSPFTPVVGGTGVKVEGESGLREGYTDYVQDMLQRASGLLARRSVDPLTGQPTYTGPQFGSTGAGGYGTQTAQTLKDLQTQRENMMGMGANKTPAYQPYQYSFTTKSAKSGGVMSLMDDSYADGGMTGSQVVPSTFDSPSTYSPTTYGSNFTPPTNLYTAGNITSGYTAPQTMYSPATVSSTYTAPAAFKGADITTNTFDTAAQKQYMSPYTSGVIDPQLREAKRQSEIQGMANAAKFTQAGAFGGARNILAETERQRNLNMQLGDIYGRGQQEAFLNAQQQFEREQARNLQAQQIEEQSRQFGAGLSARAAELSATLGIDAAKATEIARQEAGRQALTSAQTAGQLGLQAQTAQEAAKQAAGQQALSAAQIAGQLGLEGSRLSEQSKQFGAQYGLQTAQSEAQYQQLARQLQQQAEEAQARGDQFAANLALQQLQEAQRAAEASRAFEYTQARDTYLDPFRELGYASQLLTGLPIKAGDTGVSPLAEAIAGTVGGASIVNSILSNPTTIADLKKALGLPPG